MEGSKSGGNEGHVVSKRSWREREREEVRRRDGRGKERRAERASSFFQPATFVPRAAFSEREGPRQGLMGRN